MQGGLTAYKMLRVYGHQPLSKLLNLLLCNRIVSCQTLLRNAPSFYGAAKYLPGKMITDWLISRTIGRAFTAGETVPQMERAVDFLHSRGISPIVQYLPAVQSEGPLPQNILQKNAVFYRRSSDAAALHPNNYFSLKISAIINIELLQKYNRAVEFRDSLWADSCEDGRFSSEKMFDNLQKIYQGLTQEDYCQYLSAVHGFAGKAAEFTIDQLSFRLSHRPYYLYQEQKNEPLVCRILLPLDQQQRHSIQQFKLRLDKILKGNYQHQNCPKVLWEAEQTSIQKAIDDFGMQNQLRYNKGRAYVVSTLQNQMDGAKDSLKLQMEQALRQGLYFGVNFVTGGFQPAQQGAKDEGSLDNLVSNFQQVCVSDLRGQILISDHNEKHINAIFALRNRYPSVMRVHFAQFHNTGGHLTSQLRVKRESVHNMLPWGQNETVIPYLLYRSRDIAGAGLPLATQYSLLKHELRVRALGP